MINMRKALQASYILSNVTKYEYLAVIFQTSDCVVGVTHPFTYKKTADTLIRYRRLYH